MDRKELRQLSKNQLIDIIFDLHQKLEQMLKLYENTHTPSSKIRSKKNTKQDGSKSRFPGKPEGGNGGGIDIPRPDETKLIEKQNCDCGGKLQQSGQYHFRQMDLPTPKFITTQYNVNVYICKSCGKNIDAGENLHKGFYGPIITAFAGCLKEEGLSYGAIGRFMKNVYNLSISSVAIFNKLSELVLLMKPEREKIRRAICKNNFAHMDETGLRKDGQNGYVWNVSTQTHCLFEYDQSRGALVAKRLLGGFKGALVTDDFKSYLWYLLRQLCWAHLLREADEYAEDYEDSRVLYNRLLQLYHNAKEAQKKSEVDRYGEFVLELEDIARCYHPIDGCKKMFSKLHNRAALWLLGVKISNVPLTNNHAERCLRKIVLHRNRIGCIRNEKGEGFINIFMSCVSTWRLQEKNVYEKLHNYALLT